jgi:hypothetical protein
MAAEDAPRYRRVLLKLSGEALLGKRQYGIDFDVVRSIESFWIGSALLPPRELAGAGV